MNRHNTVERQVATSVENDIQTSSQTPNHTVRVKCEPQEVVALQTEGSPSFTNRKETGQRSNSVSPVW